MRPPWMAEVPETQEQLSGRPPWMAEVPETQEQLSGRHCLPFPRWANLFILRRPTNRSHL